VLTIVLFGCRRHLAQYPTANGSTRAGASSAPAEWVSQREVTLPTVGG
jgi:hypothetical protein